MKVLRRNADGKQETLALDLAGAVPKDKGFRLQEGDTVLVPKGNTFFVFGEVKKPGAYQLDKDTNVVHVGDAAKQTEYVLEQIKAVIESAGGTMADITFNHIFITDWANYAAVNTVYAKYFPGDKPARYCIQCGLVKKEALVEIATIAHVGRPG